jgi:N-acetylmuramic acid 6-phosphate (MurNAc-6-P) etherase
MKGESARDELQRDEKALAAAGLVDPEVLELVGAGGDTTYVIRARRRDRPRRR